MRKLGHLGCLALLSLMLGGCAAGQARERAELEAAWQRALPLKFSERDANRNYRSDTLDILDGARSEVAYRPRYRSVYYPQQGYPPLKEGVCTDLIWRAYLMAGYDLKALMDRDIAENIQAYTRVKGQPDPDIDFRRVPNQKVFFERHGESLTTEIIPGQAENLTQWQGGDVVTFSGPDHVAIVSDRRNQLGVPYLIHNPDPRPVEADDLWPLYQRGRLTGHYRFPRN